MTSFLIISCSGNDEITNQTYVTTIRVSVAIDAITEMDINTALVVTSASAPTSKQAETPSGICATITVEESFFRKFS